MPEAFRAVAATVVELNSHGEIEIKQGDATVAIPLDRLSALIKTMRKTSQTELEDEPVTLTQIHAGDKPRRANGAA